MIENMNLYINHIVPSQCRYCVKYATKECECEIENCECKNCEKEE